MFCLYITPKEVIHTLTHHLDTEHHVVNDKDGLAISNPHHHCELLKMDQQFTSNDFVVPFYDFKRVILYLPKKEFAYFELVILKIANNSNQLRGPPTA